MVLRGAGPYHLGGFPWAYLIRAASPPIRQPSHHHCVGRNTQKQRQPNPEKEITRAHQGLLHLLHAADGCEVHADLVRVHDVHGNHLKNNAHPGVRRAQHKLGAHFALFVARASTSGWCDSHEVVDLSTEITPRQMTYQGPSWLAGNLKQTANRDHMDANNRDDI